MRVYICVYMYVYVYIRVHTLYHTHISDCISSRNSHIQEIYVSVSDVQACLYMLYHTHICVLSHRRVCAFRVSVYCIQTQLCDRHRHVCDIRCLYITCVGTHTYNTHTYNVSVYYVCRQCLYITCVGALICVCDIQRVCIIGVSLYCMSYTYQCLYTLRDSHICDRYFPVYICLISHTCLCLYVLYYTNVCV